MKNSIKRENCQPSNINLLQNITTGTYMKLNPNFMNLLAQLESVAPAGDREAINTIRGQYAKFAMMEAEEKAEPAADAEIMKAITAWCEEKKNDPDAIKKLIADVSSTCTPLMKQAAKNRRDANYNASVEQNKEQYQQSAAAADDKMQKGTAKMTTKQDSERTAALRQANETKQQIHDQQMAKQKQKIADEYNKENPDEQVSANDVSDKFAKSAYSASHLGNKMASAPGAVDKTKAAASAAADTVSNTASGAAQVASGAVDKGVAKAKELGKNAGAAVKKGLSWLRDKFMYEAIEDGNYEKVCYLKGLNPRQFVCYCESIGYDMSAYRTIIG